MSITVSLVEAPKNRSAATRTRKARRWSQAKVKWRMSADAERPGPDPGKARREISASVLSVIPAGARLRRIEIEGSILTGRPLRGTIDTKGAQMRSKSTRLILFALPTIVAFLTAARPGDAGTILPVDQSRNVRTENVNAPQCTGEFFFDSEAAGGFEPFDAFVLTQHGCDSGFALASASQDSQIDASSMTGSGSAFSEGHGPVPGHIHAFGISYFEVTFELPSAGNFTLDAMMSAGSFPDADVGAVVLIRLWEGPQGGELILQRSVEPVVGGEINSELVEEAGVLQAGVFTLDVQAGTFLKNPVPPSRSAQASFDFTFGVSTLGDLDGDGVVGFSDLLMLLGTWGSCDPPCPPSCPADLSGDCVVGIQDLLILLQNWG